MRHFSLRECGYAIGFVLLLALLLAATYIGSYYTIIERVLIVNPDVSDPNEYVVAPLYRVDAFYEFFGPLHEFDRKVRPGYWTDIRGADIDTKRMIENSRAK
jgi:hypothetical protein